MRLWGRITVFGEYLMHEHHEGFIIPSRLCLTDEPSLCGEDFNCYDPERDASLMGLLEMGLTIQAQQIYGDLPCGYGFASSSLLSRLHLSYADTRVGDPQAALDQVDNLIHGFTPSGVDSGFALRQRTGFFYDKSWRDALISSLPSYAVLIPKEREYSLSHVRAKVLKGAKTLIQLAAAIQLQIAREEPFPYTLLFDYATALWDLRVYSEAAQDFIESALNKGFAAKGIGGLYDKAILLFMPDLPAEFPLTNSLDESYTVLHSS